MSFTLTKNSRYRIIINDVTVAEKQLGQKFYGFYIINAMHSKFYDIVDYCEEFVTDYWAASLAFNDSNGISPNGFFFCFLSKEDATTFKMTITLFVDQSQVKDNRPLKETKPKRPGVTTPYCPAEQILKALQRMSTQTLLQLYSVCFFNNGKHTSYGITVYLEDINYILKNRNIK